MESSSFPKMNFHFCLSIIGAIFCSAPAIGSSDSFSCSYNVLKDAIVGSKTHKHLVAISASRTT